LFNICYLRGNTSPGYIVLTTTQTFIFTVKKKKNYKCVCSVCLTIGFIRLNHSDSFMLCSLNNKFKPGDNLVKEIIYQIIQHEFVDDPCLCSLCHNISINSQHHFRELLASYLTNHTQTVISISSKRLIRQINSDFLNGTTELHCAFFAKNQSIRTGAHNVISTDICTIRILT